MAPRIEFSTGVSLGISPTPISPSPRNWCATNVQTNKVKPPRMPAGRIRFIFGSPSANDLGPADTSLVSLKVANPLQYGPDDQRQRHRCVIENFRETSAFFWRHKFAPRNSFRVCAAAEAAPMHRLRADAHAVVVALHRKFFAAAPRQQFRINAELLRPVAWHSSADSQDSHSFRGQHGIGKLFKIFEWIEPQYWPLIAQPRNLVQRKVNTQLRIAERRNKNGNIMLVRRFQNSPPRRRLVQILADPPVELPTAVNVLRFPFVENVVHHIFNVIEIRLRLQRIVNSVIPRLQEIPVP